jgi:hypothetical protein
MSSEESKYEPEALLNGLYKVKTFEDVFQLMNNIKFAVLGTLYKMMPENYGMCEPLFYFGMAMGAVYTLLDSYLFAIRLSLPFRYDLRDEIVRDLKDLIGAYANLRNGELARAQYDFEAISNYARKEISSFYENLEEYMKRRTKKQGPTEF